MLKKLEASLLSLALFLTSVLPAGLVPALSAQTDDSAPSGGEVDWAQRLSDDSAKLDAAKLAERWDDADSMHSGWSDERAAYQSALKDMSSKDRWAVKSKADPILKKLDAANKELQDQLDAKAQLIDKFNRLAAITDGLKSPPVNSPGSMRQWDQDVKQILGEWDQWDKSVESLRRGSHRRELHSLRSPYDEFLSFAKTMSPYGIGARIAADPAQANLYFKDGKLTAMAVMIAHGDPSTTGRLRMMDSLQDELAKAEPDMSKVQGLADRIFGEDPKNVPRDLQTAYQSYQKLAEEKGWNPAEKKFVTPKVPETGPAKSASTTHPLSDSEVQFRNALNDARTAMLGRDKTPTYSDIPGVKFAVEARAADFAAEGAKLLTGKEKDFYDKYSKQHQCDQPGRQQVECAAEVQGLLYGGLDGKGDKAWRAYQRKADATQSEQKATDALAAACASGKIADGQCPKTALDKAYRLQVYQYAMAAKQMCYAAKDPSDPNQCPLSPEAWRTAINVVCVPDGGKPDDSKLTCSNIADARSDRIKDAVSKKAWAPDLADLDTPNIINDRWFTSISDMRKADWDADAYAKAKGHPEVPYADKLAEWKKTWDGVLKQVDDLGTKYDARSADFAAMAAWLRGQQGTLSDERKAELVKLAKVPDAAALAAAPAQAKADFASEIDKLTASMKAQGDELHAFAKSPPDDPAQLKAFFKKVGFTVVDADFAKDHPDEYAKFASGLVDQLREQDELQVMQGLGAKLNDQYDLEAKQGLKSSDSRVRRWAQAVLDRKDADAAFDKLFDGRRKEIAGIQDPDLRAQAQKALENRIGQYGRAYGAQQELVGFVGGLYSKMMIPGGHQYPGWMVGDPSIAFVEWRSGKSIKDDIEKDPAGDNTPERQALLATLQEKYPNGKYPYVLYTQHGTKKIDTGQVTDDGKPIIAKVSQGTFASGDGFFRGNITKTETLALNGTPYSFSSQQLAFGAKQAGKGPGLAGTVGPGGFYVELNKDGADNLLTSNVYQKMPGIFDDGYFRGTTHYAATYTDPHTGQQASYDLRTGPQLSTLTGRYDVGDDGNLRLDQKWDGTVVKQTKLRDDFTDGAIKPSDLKIDEFHGTVKVREGANGPDFRNAGAIGYGTGELRRLDKGQDWAAAEHAHQELYVDGNITRERDWHDKDSVSHGQMYSDSAYTYTHYRDITIQDVLGRTSTVQEIRIGTGEGALDQAAGGGDANPIVRVHQRSEVTLVKDARGNVVSSNWTDTDFNVESGEIQNTGDGVALKKSVTNYSRDEVKHTITAHTEFIGQPSEVVNGRGKNGWSHGDTTDQTIYLPGSKEYDAGKRSASVTKDAAGGLIRNTAVGIEHQDDKAAGEHFSYVRTDTTGPNGMRDVELDGLHRGNGDPVDPTSKKHHLVQFEANTDVNGEDGNKYHTYRAYFDMKDAPSAAVMGGDSWDKKKAMSVEYTNVAVKQDDGSYQMVNHATGYVRFDNGSSWITRNDKTWRLNYDGLQQMMDGMGPGRHPVFVNQDGDPIKKQQTVEMKDGFLVLRDDDGKILNVGKIDKDGRWFTSDEASAKKMEDMVADERSTLETIAHYTVEPVGKAIGGVVQAGWGLAEIAVGATFSQIGFLISPFAGSDNMFTDVGHTIGHLGTQQLLTNQITRWTWDAMGISTKEQNEMIKQVSDLWITNDTTRSMVSSNESDAAKYARQDDWSGGGDLHQDAYWTRDANAVFYDATKAGGAAGAIGWVGYAAFKVADTYANMEAFGGLGEAVGGVVGDLAGAGAKSLGAGAEGTMMAARIGAGVFETAPGIIMGAQFAGGLANELGHLDSGRDIAKFAVDFGATAIGMGAAGMKGDTELNAKGLKELGAGTARAGLMMGAQTLATAGLHGIGMGYPGAGLVGAGAIDLGMRAGDTKKQVNDWRDGKFTSEGDQKWAERLNQKGLISNADMGKFGLSSDGSVQTPGFDGGRGLSGAAGTGKLGPGPDTKFFSDAAAPKPGTKRVTDVPTPALDGPAHVAPDVKAPAAGPLETRAPAPDHAMHPDARAGPSADAGPGPRDDTRTFNLGPGHEKAPTADHPVQVADARSARPDAVGEAAVSRPAALDAERLQPSKEAPRQDAKAEEKVEGGKVQAGADKKSADARTQEAGEKPDNVVDLAKYREAKARARAEETAPSDEKEPAALGARKAKSSSQAADSEASEATSGARLKASAPSENAPERVADSKADSSRSQPKDTADSKGPDRPAPKLLDRVLGGIANLFRSKPAEPAENTASVPERRLSDEEKVQEIKKFVRKVVASDPALARDPGFKRVLDKLDHLEIRFEPLRDGVHAEFDYKNDAILINDKLIDVAPSRLGASVIHEATHAADMDVFVDYYVRRFGETGAIRRLGGPNDSVTPGVQEEFRSHNMEARFSAAARNSAQFKAETLPAERLDPETRMVEQHLTHLEGRMESNSLEGYVRDAYPENRDLSTLVADRRAELEQLSGALKAVREKRPLTAEQRDFLADQGLNPSSKQEMVEKLRDVEHELAALELHARAELHVANHVPIDDPAAQAAFDDALKRLDPASVRAAQGGNFHEARVARLVEKAIETARGAGEVIRPEDELLIRAASRLRNVAPEAIESDPGLADFFRRTKLKASEVRALSEGMRLEADPLKASRQHDQFVDDVLDRFPAGRAHFALEWGERISALDHLSLVAEPGHAIEALRARDPRLSEPGAAAEALRLLGEVENSYGARHLKDVGSGGILADARPLEAAKVELARRAGLRGGRAAPEPEIEPETLPLKNRSSKDASGEPELDRAVEHGIEKYAEKVNGEFPGAIGEAQLAGAEKLARVLMAHGFDPAMQDGWIKPDARFDQIPLQGFKFHVPLPERLELRAELLDHLLRSGALNMTDMAFKVHGLYDGMVLRSPEQAGKFITVYPKEGVPAEVAVHLERSVKDFYSQRGLDPSRAVKANEPDHGWITGRFGRQKVSMAELIGPDGREIPAVHGDSKYHDDVPITDKIVVEFRNPILDRDGQPILAQTHEGVVVHDAESGLPLLEGGWRLTEVEGGRLGIADAEGKLLLDDEGKPALFRNVTNLRDYGRFLVDPANPRKPAMENGRFLTDDRSDPQQERKFGMTLDLGQERLRQAEAALIDALLPGAVKGRAYENPNVFDVELGGRAAGVAKLDLNPGELETAKKAAAVKLPRGSENVHIPKVLSEGENGAVFEKALGRSLGEYLEGKAKWEGEPISPQEWSAFKRAIKALNRAGVEHFDLKNPDNILVWRDAAGNIQFELIDWGGRTHATRMPDAEALVRLERDLGSMNMLRDPTFMERVKDFFGIRPDLTPVAEAPALLPGQASPPGLMPAIPELAPRPSKPDLGRRKSKSAASEESVDELAQRLVETPREPAPGATAPASRSDFAKKLADRWQNGDLEQTRAIGESARRLADEGDIHPIQDLFDQIAKPIVAGPVPETSLKPVQEARWGDRAREELRERMPTLVRALEDPAKLQALMSALSFLRSAIPYDKAFTSDKGPIEYGRDNEIEFHLNELRISPVSESFRRFVITADSPEGPFSVEFKMPGQDYEKRSLKESNFQAAHELVKAHPGDAGTVEPLYYQSFLGKTRLYGEEMNFQELVPLGVGVFRYQEGKRLRNAEPLIERIAKEKGVSPSEIRLGAEADAAAEAIRLHQLGWRGDGPFGGEMHWENVRVLRDGRAVLVADFNAFEKVPLTPEQRAKETTGLISRGGPENIPWRERLAPLVEAKLSKGVTDPEELSRLRKDVRVELDLEPAPSDSNGPSDKLDLKNRASKGNVPPEIDRWNDWFMRSHSEPPGRLIETHPDGSATWKMPKDTVDAVPFREVMMELAPDLPQPSNEALVRLPSLDALRKAVFEKTGFELSLPRKGGRTELSEARFMELLSQGKYPLRDVHDLATHLPGLLRVDVAEVRVVAGLSREIQKAEFADWGPGEAMTSRIGMLLDESITAVAPRRGELIDDAVKAVMKELSAETPAFRNETADWAEKLDNPAARELARRIRAESQGPQPPSVKPELGRRQSKSAADEAAGKETFAEKARLIEEHMLRIAREDPIAKKELGHLLDVPDKELGRARIRFENRPGELPASSNAMYFKDSHEIVFSRRLAEVPHELLAATAAHETQHAYDRAARPKEFFGVLQDEYRGHEAERIFFEAALRHADKTGADLTRGGEATRKFFQEKKLVADKRAAGELEPYLKELYAKKAPQPLSDLEDGIRFYTDRQAKLADGIRASEPGAERDALIAKYLAADAELERLKISADASLAVLSRPPELSAKAAALWDRIVEKNDPEGAAAVRNGDVRSVEPAENLQRAIDAARAAGEIISPRQELLLRTAQRWHGMMDADAMDWLSKSPEAHEYLKESGLGLGETAALMEAGDSHWNAGERAKLQREALDGIMDAFPRGEKAWAVRWADRMAVLEQAAEYFREPESVRDHAVARAKALREAEQPVSDRQAIEETARHIAELESRPGFADAKAKGLISERQLAALERNKSYFSELAAAPPERSLLGRAWDALTSAFRSRPPERVETAEPPPLPGASSLASLKLEESNEPIPLLRRKPVGAPDMLGDRPLSRGKEISPELELRPGRRFGGGSYGDVYAVDSAAGPLAVKLQKADHPADSNSVRDSVEKGRDLRKAFEDPVRRPDRPAPANFRIARVVDYGWLDPAEVDQSRAPAKPLGLLDRFRSLWNSDRVPAGRVEAVVMERNRGVSLWQYALNGGRLTMEDELSIYGGIDRMHSLGFAHGDLAARNIVVEVDPRTGEKTFTLVDFGRLVRRSEARYDAAYQADREFNARDAIRDMGGPAPEKGPIEGYLTNLKIGRGYTPIPLSEGALTLTVRGAAEPVRISREIAGPVRVEFGGQRIVLENKHENAWLAVDGEGRLIDSRADPMGTRIRIALIGDTLTILDMKGDSVAKREPLAPPRRLELKGRQSRGEPIPSLPEKIEPVPRHGTRADPEGQNSTFDARLGDGTPVYVKLGYDQGHDYVKDHADPVERNTTLDHEAQLTQKAWLDYRDPSLAPEAPADPNFILPEVLGLGPLPEPLEHLLLRNGVVPEPANVHAFVVREIPGRSLETYYDESTGSFRPKDGHPVMKEELFDSLERGLKRLHALGIAHMDVHIGNIIIGDETVGLIDFGRSYEKTAKPTWNFEASKFKDIRDLENIRQVLLEEGFLIPRGQTPPEPTRRIELKNRPSRDSGAASGNEALLKQAAAERSDGTYVPAPAAFARHGGEPAELTKILSQRGSGGTVFEAMVGGQEAAVKVYDAPHIPDGSTPKAQEYLWNKKVRYLESEIALGRRMQAAVPDMAPAVIGEVDVGGNPAWAMERIRGKDLSALTPDEAARLLSPETAKKVADGIRRLNDSGLGGGDSPQIMILTEDQTLNGVAHKAGDPIFMDPGSLRERAYREFWLTPGEFAAKVERVRLGSKGPSSGLELKGRASKNSTAEDLNGDDGDGGKWSYSTSQEKKIPPEVKMRLGPFPLKLEQEFATFVDHQGQVHLVDLKAKGDAPAVYRLLKKFTGEESGASDKEWIHRILKHHVEEALPDAEIHRLHPPPVHPGAPPAGVPDQPIPWSGPMPAAVHKTDGGREDYRVRTLGQAVGLALRLAQINPATAEKIYDEDTGMLIGYETPKSQVHFHPSDLAGHAADTVGNDSYAMKPHVNYSNWYGGKKGKGGKFGHVNFGDKK
jgi:tRNA A-37 threonylcarbamoyl transferase component Bud32